VLARGFGGEGGEEGQEIGAGGLPRGKQTSTDVAMGGGGPN